jgi:hypothetical protein
MSRHRSYFLRPPKIPANREFFAFNREFGKRHSERSGGLYLHISSCYVRIETNRGGKKRHQIDVIGLAALRFPAMLNKLDRPGSQAYLRLLPSLDGFGNARRGY